MAVSSRRVTGVKDDSITRDDTDEAPGPRDWTKMRHLAPYFRGPSSTQTLAEVVIKSTCCVAMAATFKRVIDEQEIPPAFLCLPALPAVLFGIQKFSSLRDDPQTMGMVTGAILGVMTGFLSAIDRFRITERLSPEGERLADLKAAPMVYSLELLHIPVVMGALMYSFTLIFERPPSGRRLRLAGMMAMCASVLVMMAYSTLGDYSQGPRVMDAQIFLAIFFAMFLVSLIPLVGRAQQCWIVIIVLWLVYMMWHSAYLDTMHWDWRNNKFPVPGYLTAMVVIFLGDVVVCHSNPRTLTYMACVDGEKKDPLEPVVNGIMWHAVTFVVQRISLFVIQRKNKKLGEATSSQEVSLNCVVMIWFLLVISRAVRATCVVKVTIVVLTLTLYWMITLTKITMSNGLFIDVVSALTLVFVTQVHHLDNLGGPALDEA